MASQSGSTVAGGESNTATGSHSFAAGFRALASGNGSFAIAAEAFNGVTTLPWAVLVDNSLAVRHLGPMSQDFYEAFGLGQDDKMISMLDAQGVSLAAIQGLDQIVQEKDKRIDALEKAVADLGRKLQLISARIGIE